MFIIFEGIHNYLWISVKNNGWKPKYKEIQVFSPVNNKYDQISKPREGSWSFKFHIESESQIGERQGQLQKACSVSSEGCW